MFGFDKFVTVFGTGNPMTVRGAGSPIKVCGADTINLCDTGNFIIVNFKLATEALASE